MDEPSKKDKSAVNIPIDNESDTKNNTTTDGLNDNNPHTANNAESADAESKKDSILVVDDEHANILALTHMLRPEYTVYAAKNGRDAIDTAIRFKPDVILLDIIMPDMDGYSVLTMLKNDDKTRGIPVIFITGLGDSDSEKRGFQLGAADYITKPFVPVIVKLRVENQIKLIRQMRLIMEKELAERSSRARLDFLMNMSHEMLTPMNAVMGMTHIAKKAKSKDQVDDCLKEIEAAAKQLLEQINNLLNTPVKNGDAKQ